MSPKEIAGDSNFSTEIYRANSCHFAEGFAHDPYGGHHLSGGKSRDGSSNRPFGTPRCPSQCAVINNCYRAFSNLQL